MQIDGSMDLWSLDAHTPTALMGAGVVGLLEGVIPKHRFPGSVPRNSNSGGTGGALDP